MLSIGDARGVYTGQLVYYGRHATLSIGDAQGVYMGQLVYYGHRATLSISDISPLRRILKGAVIYNASARAFGDYAIIASHNPDNGVRAGNPSRQRRSTTNDGKVDDAWRPPAPLLLRQQRLLSKGGMHHLIYIG
ncbi:large ribosomal subunit protein uL2-like [Miscanthus floridulus]|uniref:large ribosomal subunit protein uL2-like n=1 Tax=Miscanthus floridulus TaxID=154761 RepID=UPI003459911A